MKNLHSLASPGQEIFIVVTFRQPRFNHMSSWWKQQRHGLPKLEKNSSKTWTCAQFERELQISENLQFSTRIEKEFQFGTKKVLRPFQLAENYMNYGFPVILVDYLGAQENNGTMQNLIQTQILHIAETDLIKKEIRTNIRRRKIDIEDEIEIELIEQILIQDDCVKNPSMFLNNVTILNQIAKYEILECDENRSKDMKKEYIGTFC
jgi:hypothetical protein